MDVVVGETSSWATMEESAPVVSLQKRQKLRFPDLCPTLSDVGCGPVGNWLEEQVTSDVRVSL